ncbi:hypothetical protein ACW9H6_03280 [Pseudomonas sp. SDO528_S397]
MSPFEMTFFIMTLIMFSGCFFIVGVWIYIVFFKITEVVEGLGNSLAIQKWSAVLELGVFGRFCVLSVVSALFIFPKKSIKKGELDAEDFRNFPRSLRLWIAVTMRSALVLLYPVGIGLSYMATFIEK